MNDPQLSSVVVCDDDSRRSRSWETSISRAVGKDAFRTTALSAEEFALAVKALHQRVKQSKNQVSTPSRDEAEVFDSADFIVIDSDLTPDPATKIEQRAERVVSDHLVGEFGSNVAWLARNFSDAGVLVVVNHIHKSRTFDLTMTRFAHLPADVYVTADDVASAGLWNGNADGSFRPWSWPNLSVLSRLEAPRGVTLETRLVDLLGLGANEVSQFDQRQIDRLSPDDRDIEDVTLADVAKSTTYGFGHQPSAMISDPRQLRIALYGVRRWLDYTLVPAQNIFIDLPHLLQDRPWLAGEVRGDVAGLSEKMIEAWSIYPLPDLIPEAFSQPAASVCGRALWRVSEIPASASRGRVDADDLVFCEDTSMFEGPDDVREFASDLEGPYRSRFIKKVEGVSYTPVRRLSF